MASVSGARTVPRYPSRTRRRPLLIAVVAAIAAVGIGWLLWAAYVHAQPAVSGAVHVWNVDSDQKVSFTLTVERRDPSVPSSCRVIAQATNFETVGEKTIGIGPARDTVVDVPTSMRTIRRATSVSVGQCWTNS
jgi:hypothetical protein